MTHGYDEESGPCHNVEAPDRYHEQYEVWHQAVKFLEKRDKERVKAWQDEVDGFLNFASMFSAVVTFFITFSYTTLQPDTGAQAVQILLHISQQLDTRVLPGDAFPGFESFQPDTGVVTLNTLLFLSLLCSVIASGKGLWVKQWLREFTLDLPRKPRELARMLELRHAGLKIWHMRGIVSTISLLLQLSVALFANALVLLVWPVDAILRYIVCGVAIVWISVTLIAAVCPVVWPGCPYKSPLARCFLRVAHLTRRFLSRRLNAQAHASFEAHERDVAEKVGTEYELAALIYLNNHYWGHEKLDRINMCFKDITPPQKSLECIEQIVSEHIGCRPETLNPLRAAEKGRTLDDSSSLHLMALWLDIYSANKQKEGLEDSTKMDIGTTFKIILGAQAHVHHVRHHRRRRQHEQMWRKRVFLSK